MKRSYELYDDAGFVLFDPKEVQAIIKQPTATGYIAAIQVTLTNGCKYIIKNELAYYPELENLKANSMKIEKMKNMKLGEVEFFQYDQTQYSLFNYALRVPGGWVYVSTDTNDNPLASTFVPEGQNG